METLLTVANGYSRKRPKETLKVRYMTVDEAKALNYGDGVLFLDRYGEARDAKVIGRPKVWKTRPGDVDVSCKYGLREYFTVRFRGGCLGGTELVVEVRDANA